ncbi:hypothetical protein IV203_012673 [Nitzschia inconspicua]|uniref:Uncharacterized protein n=1 Tax=Nitzschia inconspicua TaxID=303405 RepID=A0A9K3K4Z7_9STRA|nr:hypothetical protein IV203_014260 [Nitzschia inconspicua]KAG7350076.1 hypothetical protein IV203_012673 [Nitzschia inconspicua]
MSFEEELCIAPVPLVMNQVLQWLYLSLQRYLFIALGPSLNCPVLVFAVCRQIQRRKFNVMNTIWKTVL